MVCAPGFFATFWNSKTFGQCIDALETEFAGNVTFVLGKNLRAELLFKVSTDDPYNFAKASLDCVVNAVIHDALSLRTKCVELLETTIAATHTCSKEE